MLSPQARERPPANAGMAPKDDFQFNSNSNSNSKSNSNSWVTIASYPCGGPHVQGEFGSLGWDAVCFSGHA